MPHKSHRMDGNSLSAFASLDVNRREREALEALARLSAATDREVAAEMARANPTLPPNDPNVARPRITALLYRKAVKKVGNKLEGRTRNRVVALSRRLCRS